MRKLVLVGLSAGLGSLALSAAQADEGNASLAAGVMGQAAIAPAMRGVGPAASPRPMPAVATPHGAWGRRVNGRWAAGANAPGGWSGYYRPVAGWTLPSYWINPAYYISDWQGYGLPVPAAGYGWSRYYDDAVLTDRYGRVVDARYGYDWDRYGGYDDDYAPAYEDRRDRTGNTVAGAVVGGVVGGLAGNAIAGRGDKTAGTLLGAGVGAIAGGAIGNSVGKYKKPKHYRARPYEDYAYGAPPPPLSYDGQWTGTWYGADGRPYSGTFDGRFDGNARGVYQAYAAPAPLPYAPGPAYGYGYGYGAAGGYAASSYYSAVDYAAPTVVTTTVTTEETTYSARSARRAVVRKARPRPRVVCCPCGC